jgi:signal transduction histidine kinase
MRLSRRLTIHLALLVIAAGALCAAAAWGFWGLRQNLDAAVAGHDRLRLLYEVGVPISAARAAMRGGAGAADAPIAVRRARDRALRLAESSGPVVDPTIARVIEQLNTAAAALDSSRPALARRALDQALSDIATQVAADRATIAALEAAGRRRVTVTGYIMLGIGLAIMLLAGVGGAWQYRRIIHSLHHVRLAARRIADGRFDQRVDAWGDTEFQQLAEEFNRMADRLERLYGELDQRAQSLSRQLLRSERLASVGYLAAGVAHEINNPLSIIAGHAELAARRLGRAESTDSADQQALAEALQVMQEQAHRCKQITERLLGLARDQPADRQPQDIGRLVERTIAIVRGLPQARCRSIVAHLPPDPLTVSVNPAQMQQVLINLILNALGATDESTGRVELAVDRIDQQVRITVQDNGRGMDQATLGRIFEPFFTTRRSPENPGSGLGLSIAHAIVENHGGSLTAHSEGPGRGTGMTITLPVD